MAVAAASRTSASVGLVEEFCLPGTNARADVVVIGRELASYEIKSAADSLRRLPAQVSAFSRVFDRCSLVVAARHFEKAAPLVPGSWGLVTVEADQTLTRLIVLREAMPNPSVDVEVLVRLLWRDEVAQALRDHGQEPELHRGRGGMWSQLLACASERSIRATVRNALRDRKDWAGQSGASRITLAHAPAR